jgi:hypothetical protein
MIKNIDTATVVSITTGRMLTDFDLLAEAIQHATGETDDLASIGVAIMGPLAKDNIMKQYPDLPEGFTGTDFDGFVADCRSRFGETLAIAAP